MSWIQKFFTAKFPASWALALFALLPLDCRQAVPKKPPPRAEKDAAASSQLRADEVTDIDKNDMSGNSDNLSNARKPLEPPWQTAVRAETERIRRERRARAQSHWQIALRTDTPTIVPCQPMYVTIKMTNATNQARNLDEFFGNSGIRVLVGRKGEQPPVEDQSSSEEMIVCGQGFDEQEKVVPGKGSVFSNRMLTTDRVDGSTSDSPAPKRIFSEPGEYMVYAAVVDPRERFDVLRSEPLVVTVREPTESEAPYVEFFREGRQIPPHYGFSKVNEEAYDKVRGQRQRTAAFRQKVNAETIDTLRDMLAKHPDPPVADDMRHYLMVQLIMSANRRDELGRDLGYDRDVLAAAAQQYLDIAPERKQLRRWRIKTWRDLSTRFELDHAQPMFQILASWRVSSPFYEDEVESQAALDEIIAKIEARYAQHARARANAPPPKRNALPTN